ncbi:MAG: hypothetical protein FWD37_02080, partial [Methanomassiliicoccaceae archaeon]|nr:hypothetical protein [Methanomassiliicoccaceae archaeon]
IMFGNMPNCDGNFVLTGDEKDILLAKEPNAKPFIRHYLGAKDFINNKHQKRYCIWLKDVPYSALKNCNLILDRVNRVREFRSKSSAKATRDKAEDAELFFYISHTETKYILVPCHSSESRKYIPMDFVSPEIISSNANMIIPGATLYHFGILTSIVHMYWVKAVCGRLKSDYRYSGSVVYNNFPWPHLLNEEKKVIEKLAQGVIDARLKYPESTFADMYGENSMSFHKELVKAHNELDSAVKKLYGFEKDTPESVIVAELMERYKKLTE